MKRKPHICCSSSSFQHGAHPGLGTEDALVQYPSFVGVLQCFSSLWRQFLIRDTLGAGSPLLGFGHFCLISSWHSVWRGIKSIWNVWNVTIKIAETNLVHQNIGPSFGQSDIIKGWGYYYYLSAWAISVHFEELFEHKTPQWWPHQTVCFVLFTDTDIWHFSFSWRNRTL